MHCHLKAGSTQECWQGSRGMEAILEDSEMMQHNVRGVCQDIPVLRCILDCTVSTEINIACYRSESYILWVVRDNSGDEEGIYKVGISQRETKAVWIATWIKALTEPSRKMSLIGTLSEFDGEQTSWNSYVERRTVFQCKRHPRRQASSSISYSGWC